MKPSSFGLLALIFVGAGLGLSAGCARTSIAAAAGSTDEASRPRVDAAATRLAGVRSALASGRDPSMRCKALVGSIDALRADREPPSLRLVVAIDRTCGYDAPLAWAKQNLDAIGAGGSVATSCVHVADALTELRRFGHGEETPVQAIDAAFRGACHA